MDATPAVSGFTISSDPAQLDLDAVHALLSSTYWAAMIPRVTMERSIANSIVFGVYDRSHAQRRQVGFARVITDRATYAYLCDVIIDESCRGKGLGKLIMLAVKSHPELQGLRRFQLMTRDAHGLYAQFGFTAPARHNALMEWTDNEVYRRTAKVE